MPEEKIHDFDKSRVIGESYEKKLDSFYEKRFFINNVDLQAQKSGIDRYFTAKNNGFRYSIEYKSDEVAARTNNAFIETISVDTANKPGWAFTSCAQILIYYIPPWNRAYCITTMTIKHHLSEWGKIYLIAPSKNNEYITYGLKMPISDFKTYCFAIEDIT